MATLIVSFAVLMGGYGVALWAGDASGARGLCWLAIACGLLLIIDCLLLLAALAIEQLVRTNDPRTTYSASDTRVGAGGEPIENEP
jgi:hypothetical protein